MNPVILIFIDGVGIGENDPVSNGFLKLGAKFLTDIFGEIPTLSNPVLFNGSGYVFPIDPLMGIGGLPQSGTGQTSIFCGFNAPSFIGKHFGPYPYSTLIPEIKEKNIFIDFIRKGKKAYFLNAYPKPFFDYIATGRRRLSVTTLSCLLNNIKINSEIEVRNKEALTPEITNERWNKRLDYNLDIIAPSEAADILLAEAEKNDLTVYEYYFTDHFGHGRYPDELEEGFRNLDEFLYSILVRINIKKFTLLLCSDHGNFENLSTKSHTLNPCLTISYGKESKYFFNSIKDLSQIKKAILDIQ